MGTSTSFRQVHEKFQALEGGLGKVNVAGMNAAAAFTKKAVMMQLGSTGRPVVMSRVGKKGRQGRHKIGVRYDIKKAESTTVALVRAFGNMHWLENGTQAHWIPRGRSQKAFIGRGDFEGLRGQKANAKQRKRMVMPDGQVRTGPVWHRGAAARRPWSRGVALAVRHTERIFADELTKAVRKVF